METDTALESFESKYLNQTVAVEGIPSPVYVSCITNGVVTLADMNDPLLVHQIKQEDVNVTGMLDVNHLKGMANAAKEHFKGQVDVAMQQVDALKRSKRTYEDIYKMAP